MIIKKQRESLRGLSHEDKVKKLQKLTRVPLRNLKTNIIESDFEQDDIDIPISLKQVGIKEGVRAPSLQKDRLVSNKQKQRDQYDQQKINKSIRAMTNQLYTLQRQRQNLSKKEQKQIIQPNISNFTIEEIDLELQKLSCNNTQSRDDLKCKGRHKRNQSSMQQLQRENVVELNDIKEKIDQQGNRMNLNVNKKQTLMRRTQFLPQRQTQPIYSAQTPVHLSVHNNQKPSKPQISQNKRQSSQSSVTKRFSRTKRDTDLSNGDNLIDKKLKFNRSSNLNSKQIPNPNISNKQNHENFEAPKRHLLTQRLSCQQMSTYERPQTALKKKKNVGKPFNHHHEEPYHNIFQNGLKKDLITLKPNLNSQSTRQRIRQQIVQFQRLSEEEVFNKFQQDNIRSYTFNQREKELLTQMYKNYKQTIDLLRISL